MKFKPQFAQVALVLAFLLVGHIIAKADAVSDWNLIAVQRIGAAVPARPAPVGFLDIAIVNAAMYDAVQAIVREYKPYQVQIPGASGRTDAAAAKAAHDALVSLFPNQAGTIDSIYGAYLVNKGIPDTD